MSDTSASPPASGWHGRIFALGLMLWTAISGGLGYLIKGYADHQIDFQFETDKLRDEHELAFQAEQLKDFWYPIYFRLQLDTNIWADIASDKPNKKLLALRPELVDKLLIPNHDEVVKILEAKYYLGAKEINETENLRAWFLEYIDHVAVYHAIRAKAVTDPTLVAASPAGFDKPFPGETGSRHPCSPGAPCFVDAVTDITDKLQKKYDRNTEKFFRRTSFSESSPSATASR